MLESIAVVMCVQFTLHTVKWEVLKLLGSYMGFLPYFRCIMKWMEVKETCPICQRNCRHENENGNNYSAERTPLLPNVDIIF